MRKTISFLLVILMLGLLCVSAFADEALIISPTAEKEFLIEFKDYGNGATPTITTAEVPEGQTIRYDIDKNSAYKFTGFEIEGSYVIVEGSLAGDYIVLRPTSDLVVVAKYENVPITTSPSDTDSHSPQTGFDPILMGIAVVILSSCAVAIVIVTKRIAILHKK